MAPGNMNNIQHCISDHCASRCRKSLWAASYMTLVIWNPYKITNEILISPKTEVFE
ncbi:hypothetical protein SK128_002994 [Halocaridina rubra]|uniref:Uncharacterized protein n=1 Tax=Halocaridina rubra TaxID=373956 RepID=A0AAN8XDA8_HALRR